MVSSRVRTPPWENLLQNVLSPIWLSPPPRPHGVIEGLTPFSQKCLPHITCCQSTIRNTPHQLYKFLLQGYVAIVSVLFSISLFDQTNIVTNSFLVLLDLSCHSSISISIVAFSVQLLENNYELFELHLTHMGIILNLYLKTGISFCLGLWWCIPSSDKKFYQGVMY